MPEANPTLIPETYQCAKMDGTCEFGFCFKKPGSEDVEFDIVIGSVNADTPAKNVVAHVVERLKQYQWVADAVCDASRGRLV